MQLDYLPGPNSIVIWYCRRQPTIIPRPFLPLLPAAGSTWLLCRATLSHQTIPVVRYTRLADVRFLAKCADNPLSAVSTTHLLKWSKTANKKRKYMPFDLKSPLATHDESAVGWGLVTGLSAATVTPPCKVWGVLGYATTMNISFCYFLPTVLPHHRALATTAVRRLQQWLFPENDVSAITSSLGWKNTRLTSCPPFSTIEGSRRCRCSISPYHARDGSLLLPTGLLLAPCCWYPRVSKKAGFENTALLPFQASSRA